MNFQQKVDARFDELDAKIAYLESGEQAVAEAVLILSEAARQISAGSLAPDWASAEPHWNAAADHIEACQKTLKSLLTIG